jgi:predicted ATPase
VRRDLPAGTVTFLFTDVEGSTKLLHELGPERYADTLAEHRRIVREAVGAHGGVEVDTQGDAFFMAFPSVRGALDAAAEATEELARGPVRVRVGIHTGTPHVTDEGYIGEDVHLGARIAASGHGGQVLLSQATRELVDAELTYLGEHRLKDFREPIAIFQLGPARFPPLKTISNTNLPRPASSFVGREAQVEEVVSLLENGVRLLTLTGPGGSGKTRLAIEAATELVPTVKAGVFWVGLATLNDPALVTTTIGETLGAADGLAEHIGDRELVLLVDNLEQVIDAAPELASLVESCPNLRLLVTSRELLRVRGEVEYPVLPLAEPDAVELFCARAQIDSDPTVHGLCRALDNLPLALELAAARASVLSPKQILARLSSRLDLLKGGRDVDPRQQTLRATIEWSYDLLNEVERPLFARLGTFYGGCTLAAAEQVAGADLDTLQSLVDKSLVRHTAERFWMLETIREYASERLAQSGEAEELRRRLAQWIRGIAESANLMNESEGEQRYDLVIPERDNIRAVLDWAEEADPALGLSIAVALENFWATNAPAEGAQRLTKLLQRATGIPPLLRALALRCRAGSTYIVGDYENGVRDLERALEEFRRLGDDLRVGIVLFRLAIDANRLGDRPRAQALLAESLERSRGHKKIQGQIFTLLGHFAFDEGRPDEAFALLERAADLCRQSGFRWWEKNVLQATAEYALTLERPADAFAPAREALAIARDIGDRQGIVLALAKLAWHAALTGSSRRAGRLWGAIEAEEARGGRVGQWEEDRTYYEERARAGSDPDFEQGRVGGSAMSLDEVVDYALT